MSLICYKYFESAIMTTLLMWNSLGQAKHFDLHEGRAIALYLNVLPLMDFESNSNKWVILIVLFDNC